MAFTYGFYNSLNGDRKYNADQMSEIFDGIIKDGVFAAVDGIFGTVPGAGMQVLVSSGRAWFNHTWNKNDAAYPINVDAAHVTLSRIDTVVLEVHRDTAVRMNRLRIIKGTPATSPTKPTLIKAEPLYQHALAHITIPPGATAINAGMINVRVGTSECPFVTGPLETANVDVLFQQWDYDFDSWFTNIKLQLSENVVTNLQKQIDDRVKTADKATQAEAVAGTNDTKWMTPLRTKNAIGNSGETFIDTITGTKKKARIGIVRVSSKQLDTGLTTPANNYALIADIGNQLYLKNDRLIIATTVQASVGEASFRHRVQVFNTITGALLATLTSAQSSNQYDHVTFEAVGLSTDGLCVSYQTSYQSGGGTNYLAVANSARNVAVQAPAGYSPFSISTTLWGYHSGTLLYFGAQGSVPTSTVTIGAGTLVGLYSNTLFLVGQPTTKTGRLSKIVINSASAAVVTQGIEPDYTNLSGTGIEFNYSVRLDSKVICGVAIGVSWRLYVLDMVTEKSNFATAPMDSRFEYCSSRHYLGTYKNVAYFYVQKTGEIIKLNLATYSLSYVYVGTHGKENFNSYTQPYEVLHNSPEMICRDLVFNVEMGTVSPIAGMESAPSGGTQNYYLTGVTSRASYSSNDYSGEASTVKLDIHGSPVTRSIIDVVDA